MVLAATNRPEILDPALLRPGRFDRRVSGQPAGPDGRRKILEVHTRACRWRRTSTWPTLAAATPGMVGADLTNLVNEAALLAAAHSHERVTGPTSARRWRRSCWARVRGIMLSPEEKRATAYHESGHALLGMLTPGRTRCAR